jgi:hypothetical protein
LVAVVAAAVALLEVMALVLLQIQVDLAAGLAVLAVVLL